MMNKFMEYLPNIIAAIVILVIGLFVAKIVKELLIPLFKKLNIDSYLEKIGLVNGKVSIAEVFANALYVLILIPVCIAALDALKIEAISKPAIGMLNSILVFIPRVVVAIVILFVGKFIASLVKGLLEKVLESIGTDKVVNNILKESNTKTNKEFSLSSVIANIVSFVIILFFLVEGINILQLEVLTKIGNSIISYIPYALSSAIIMGIAIIAGNFVENAINNRFEDNKIVALIVKVVIIVVGVFLTLYQLGIAKELVNSAFIIVVGAFAVAFAIAFGVGGRDFASHMLNKLENKIDNKKETKKEK
jgi:hypothetical protein